MEIEDLTAQLQSLWSPNRVSINVEAERDRPTIWEDPPGHVWHSEAAAASDAYWAEDPIANKENIPPSSWVERESHLALEELAVQARPSYFTHSPLPFHEVPQTTPDRDEMDCEIRPSWSYETLVGMGNDLADIAARLEALRQSMHESLRRVGMRDTGREVSGDRGRVKKTRQRKRCRFAPNVTVYSERQDLVEREGSRSASSDNGCRSDQESMSVRSAGSDTIAS